MTTHFFTYFLLMMALFRAAIGIVLLLKTYTDAFLPHCPIHTTNPKRRCLEAKVDGEGVINVKNVVLISDSTGVTAQSALSRAFAQFDSCNNIFTVGEEGCEVQSNVFSHVKDENTIAGIVKSAKRSEALVIYTLSDSELRTKARRMCEVRGLWGG